MTLEKSDHDVVPETQFIWLGRRKVLFNAITLEKSDYGVVPESLFIWLGRRESLFNAMTLEKPGHAVVPETQYIWLGRRGLVCVSILSHTHPEFFLRQFFWLLHCSLPVCR